MLAGVWIGIDVGGERKGFDVAVLDADLHLADVGARLSTSDVVDLVRVWKPHVVAVDSPRRAAPSGTPHRECELELNRTICGIRWTPDMAAIRSSAYYSWIQHGFPLYEALQSEEVDEIIQVFPTASWTRWIGKRIGSRAKWTREGLARLPITGIPARQNQDLRDAIAAAVTAWQHSAGQTEALGDIIVPRSQHPSAI
ncbi:MAG TPA: DUF429 domain-containing protein [Acidimicrobiales bacterium]|nr:DUF429 domain-containing protein [Acidimicrobiales bacterium]